MKYIEIANKSKEESKEMLLELQGKLRRLSFESGSKKVKDISQFGKIRKDIARIRTALRKNEISAKDSL